MKPNNIFLAVVATFPSGCAHVVPLVPDGQWHTVYGIQVPDKQVQIEIEKKNVGKRLCSSPKSIRTEVRIVHIESFQELDKLPEKLENATPRYDGIPVTLSDSGPYDMTLKGTKRTISLITGKQLLARTWDPSAWLHLRIIENKPQP
jgi:hypothetical protein